MGNRRARLERWRTPATLAAVALLLGLGFVAIERLTREIRFADVRAAIHGLSWAQIVAAVGFTAISYLALTLYDVLALRVIGRPLPWRTAALASFTSYTLSHNLGLALLTGGSARYRIYTAAGLDGPDVARVVGIASATFWTGIVTVAGAALLLRDSSITLAGVTLEPMVARLIGAAVLLAVGGLVLACAMARGPLRIWRFTLPLPGARAALAQIAIALLDTAAAAAALFVLIPHLGWAPLPAFVLAYALGIVVALVTHVPGGIGVFEAVVLAVVPGDRAAVFAALIAYRLVYYVLPLALGVALLALHEGRRQHQWPRLLRGSGALVGEVAPLVLAAASFSGGVMLLLSGSLPSLGQRVRALHALLPLPFIEASHIAASLVGTGLLLLAPGLYRRLDGAFVATRALLLAGAIFSLAKGIDYEEAAVCLALAALLQWTRGAFYRRTALTQAPLSGAWLTAIVAAVALAAWVGFFAYRRIPYDDDLWWRFALRADAPRFLRATLASAVLLAGVALWRLLGPARTIETPPADPVAVRRVLASAERTDAMLALTGDKRFLLSDDGRAMLMYQVRGASWIVMGDPIGATDMWDELLWRIRDLADRAQGRVLLYQVTGLVLDLAIGMGLQIVKYGEEAIVDLAAFRLELPRLRSVRKAERAAARKGAEFRIVPAAAVPVILDELATISDEWMRAKGHHEKGFSLGRFDPDYLRHFDMALVMVDDRIVAFANLWLTEGRQEASVDLMRHRADMPPGTMDFLFVHLIEWARERGYRRFSLGIAPLSGIAGRRLAPAWARAAALIFHHGERFYGFRGLRTYKEKYAPAWESRFIAAPRGLAMIKSLRDLSLLVGKPAARATRGSGIAARLPALPPRPVDTLFNLASS
ncbi:bifunctional lysylphosphatidylglycerol flippase/synthetase MprF [Sphingomonas sp. BK235]|uniref:bifunctional lysylphosphatidylglycerol flippase/synthetase MprF n=1 Tax=Sphingomonas sp. BK235 TaxID=2512131 RepID=UPI00104D9167|nr:bifunctional lysylphosphatidylglycerol flippase/synthetase MprF [Sphingomonas sp. BK235]TCP36857.1 phosphatidylglycerol lysyltransferase [Sphingomonas sp. BK235]